ncbi:MAG: OadG family transporter subunit [Atribacterota bacterium]|nr:OadG family transporter subunit [Atribacterota bacterium]
MYEGIKGAILLSMIAMSIVFLVLGLLALLMVGLRKMVKFSSTSIRIAKDKKVIDTEKRDIEKEGKVIPLPEEKKTVITKQEQNGEMIAVISAAVTNYLSMAESAQPIKVISIKRIMSQTLNTWLISGRQNMMTERISVSVKRKGGF